MKLESVLGLAAMSPNSSGLTITSFAYNTGSSYTEWIGRIFGEKSVFNSKRTHYSNSTRSDFLTPEEIDSRAFNMRNAIRLPPFALFPACSIEMLGFVNLDAGVKPFRMRGRQQ